MHEPNPYRAFLLSGVSLGVVNAAHMANRRDAKGTHARYLALGLLNIAPLTAWLLIAAKSAGAALALALAGRPA